LTLTTRLSLFFLTMLGLVLLGFSTVFYFLAQNYMHRQADQRLESALDTLIAAVEIRKEQVEWEPAERSLRFGSGSFGEQVAWLVTDDRGHIVDHSEMPAAEDFLPDTSRSLGESERSTLRANWQGQQWQICRQWVRAVNGPSLPRGETLGTTALGSTREMNGQSPPPQSLPKTQAQKQTLSPALAITVAMSLEPVHSTLRLTAVVLCGLSSSVWLLALFTGRLVCRRALLPVTRMAWAAGAMGPDDLTRRLPAVATGDELEDLSRAFNNLLDRLQESFQRQQQFTSDASHQLRTPLAAILGQIEVALRRERPPEEYVRVLNTVRQKGLHLRGIAESLLFLARSDAEAQSPQVETLELGSWIKELMHTWSESERSRDILWEVPEGKSFKVRSHPVLLGELVNILLDNACKYSKAGTPIRILITHDEHTVFLTVEDQGCGISEQDLPHLAEPFFRSEDSRRRGIDGMGLGLSIARRLAGAFGGALSFESKVGLGSSFTVRLQRLHEDAGAQRKQEAGNLSLTPYAGARPDDGLEASAEVPKLATRQKRALMN
jgi:signal transduction histidine kinase